MSTKMSQRTSSTQRRSNRASGNIDGPPAVAVAINYSSTSSSEERPAAAVVNTAPATAVSSTVASPHRKTVSIKRGRRTATNNENQKSTPAKTRGRKTIPGANTCVTNADPDAPNRIRIHGAKGVLFDTLPGGLFYAAATFGRGALLMTQRRVREEVVHDDDSDDALDESERTAPSVFRRIVEAPALLLPDHDGSVCVHHGHTYHVVTLAVNPPCTASTKDARANTSDAASGHLGILALKEELDGGNINALPLLKVEPEDDGFLEETL